MYPVMLALKNKKCLVVGGGSVALRKVEGLLIEGALVTVVALEPDTALVELALNKKITLDTRAYRSNETKGYYLVFAATNDKKTNKIVFEDATEDGIWVNVADDPELSTFHLPARVQRGPLQLAVASAGYAPFAIRRMRRILERKFGPEWAEWIDAATRFRARVRTVGLSTTEQEKCFDLFFENTVDEEKLKARVPKSDEENAWLATFEHSQIERQPSKASAISIAAVSNKTGFVSLVGAGPGDPGLLTIRGRQRLMAADAIVCDRLALTALPCDIPANTEIHFVGKTSGNHPVPQEEINAMLVRLAREGKRVVRFKGGDPYVFGRGGEEAMALRIAEISFEVVPCVTAAIGVPTYAGIPVTFRNEVIRVTMVTAHEADKSGGPQVRWDLLAIDPHAMLLGYMGVTSLKKVTSKLIEAGMDPNTPAALIERGTTSRQRVVASTVANLHHDATAAGLAPPALFAIGSTVRYREALDWFGVRPLIGQRIAITQAAVDFEEELELAGVEVVKVPTPITSTARMVMDALPITGCVLMSSDDVEIFEAERDAPSWVKNAKAWCMSKDAAKRAEELGWQNIEPVFEIKTVDETLAALIERTVLADTVSPS